MNYIKEISLKDNLYFIKLPNKTDKVYLDILVKSGYVEETDKVWDGSFIRALSY